MADEEEKKADGEKKGGSKKLLIIGLFLGLLLGGGGGFGAFMMLSGGDKHEAAPPEEKPVVEEAKEKLSFAKLEGVTLPIIYKNRVLGNVMIDFSLEVEGDDHKMIVIHNLPEIRDAMLRHYSDIPIGKDGSPQSIDYLQLKDTLKEISNKIVHGPMVKRVMIVQARQF